MKKFIIQLFSSGITKRISSKRVCGVIGFFTVMILIILSTIYKFEIPELTDSFLYCCVALMGVESVTRIFNNEKEIDDEVDK